MGGGQRTRGYALSTLVADITYAARPESGELIFSASTPKGEEWIGTPELTMSIAQAKTFRESAERDGLTIHPK
jgi:hypothetical protein